MPTWRELNPFRREPHKTLVASGEHVDISKENAITATLKQREAWQVDAAQAYDACGEIHNGITQVADLMSGLVVFAAVQPDEKDAKPQRSTDSKDIDTVSRLGSVDDVGQLLYDLSRLLMLIGDAQLIGVQPRPELDIHTETWMAYAMSELESVSVAVDGVIRTTVRISDFKDGKPLELRQSTNDDDDETGDTWIRVWRSHPLRRNKPDSHIRPLLGAIDELLWWDLAAAAVAKNRLALNGAVGVPDNLELPPEAGESVQLSGAQRFIRRLFNRIIATIQNPGAASAAAPLLFTYPWNESGKSGFDVITFPRENDELMEKRTERALNRIAQGFPLPPEQFFGTGDATYGGTRTISETKWREYVEPFARFVLSALTQAWYRPILRAQGDPDWAKKMLWYDPSAIITFPDMPQAADKGFEYGNVSSAGWRRIRGVPESDAPSEEERKKNMEWLRGLRGKEEKQTPETDPAEDGNDREPDDSTEPKQHKPVEKRGAPVRGKGQPVLASGATNGHNQTSLGHKLAQIDADLLSRLQVMADAAMRAEQIRAGNKLSNRAGKNPRLKALIKSVAKENVAATLGRETVVMLGMDDLFDDSFESVPDQFAQWCDAAIASALHHAGCDREFAHSRFALLYAPDEAAQLLVRDLRAQAKLLLFDRASSQGPAPESDDLLVPMSIIRKAVNKAGGNSSPSLLLATGHAVTKTIAESIGLYVNSHEWWYGPKPRSQYAAHLALDGQPFDISVAPHAPGEVDGCACVAVPVFS